MTEHTKMTNDTHEVYPSDWVKLELMVSPSGELHVKGCDREPGDHLADRAYIGWDRLKRHWRYVPPHDSLITRRNVTCGGLEGYIELYVVDRENDVYEVLTSTGGWPPLRHRGSLGKMIDFGNLWLAARVAEGWDTTGFKA